MLFKEGIRPEWEDAVNATGGHFTYQLKAQMGANTFESVTRAVWAVGSSTSRAQLEAHFKGVLC